MKSISGKQLCKIVEQKGWVLKRITGSHHIYENPELEQNYLFHQFLLTVHYSKILQINQKSASVHRLHPQNKKE
ncbi:type II toxin-antitoxin system HicA family toxin [Microcoleus sp.]|uniref:type II toxin-antitoxin system HicA family toxin n=1 Tax=Microcoleus sp. TaxID=44472 RepID=UPI003526632E